MGLVHISSRIGRDVYERILEEARETGKTKSEIIRKHLTEYYELLREKWELEEKVTQYEVMEELFESETEELKREIEEWSGEDIVSLLTDRGRDLLKKYIQHLKERYEHLSNLFDRLSDRADYLQDRVHQLENENGLLKVRLELIEKEEKERKNRLWKWLKEHILGEREWLR